MDEQTMKKLLKQLVDEEYSLDESAKYGETQEYLMDTLDDRRKLNVKLIGLLEIMLKGGEQHAA
ncbi:hypothetical protein BBD42_12970 [Paenibacillus sp. BIHB 4019]|uniref:Uncharacterized protein n=1 Tax=Paenibacillus sp. BIHB 4019 TaxID=1870819 RepID=A0A1B2DHS7_9BACL|nr:hypothetical protein [Paenibacillus sp. BIHB 4019]ANY67282.1 hypothetical protein BBD42_12970 [Paenibacillus sp. BIHB 4019]